MRTVACAECGEKWSVHEHQTSFVCNSCGMVNEVILPPVAPPDPEDEVNMWNRLLRWFRRHKT